MKYENIKPDSFFTVDGVLYSDWIPPLKCYGPLRRCSIKISDIVNLLNNDVNVVMTPEQNEALYFFVKQYTAVFVIFACHCDYFSIFYKSFHILFIPSSFT